MKPTDQLRSLLHPDPDPVDQMTARVVALNETLRLLAAQSADPMLQSKDERLERKTLRREVHEELSRCVAPPPEYVVQRPVMTDEGKTIVASAGLAEVHGGVPQA